MKRFCLLSLLFALIFSQASADNDYEVHAKAVRDSVWHWDMPMFKIRTVPAEYANESAVILADYEEISASGKSKLRFDIGTILAISKELYYTDIKRKLVKINDKAALDRFSQFSFKETIKEYGYHISNTLNTVLGARIIKPDGTIKEVNVSNAVSVSEDKKGKENYKKLAIPDLQIGDILDFFVNEDYKLDKENVPQSAFIFGNTYPTLNYKVHCELNKKLTVEYKSINGAPEFQQTVKGDITNLDVEKTNIPKFEMSYWIAPYRQLPIIRLNILNNNSPLIYKPSSAREKGCYPNLDANYIVTDSYNMLNSFATYYKLLPSKTKQYIKDYQKKHPKATKSELADFIYNVYKLNWLYQSYRSPQSFFVTLYTLFAKYDIQPTFGFAPDKAGARLNELMAHSDLTPFIVTESGHYYMLPNVYSYAGMPDADLEGETAVIEPKTDKSIPSIKLEDLANYKREALPTTTAEQNKSRFSVEVGLKNPSSSEVELKLTQTHTGYLKRSIQHQLLNFYDTDKEFRKSIGLDSDMFADISESQKLVEDYKTKVSDFRKAQRDSVISDLNETYGAKIKELKAYNIISYGISKKDSAFEYEAEFTMENLVKRAGSNYIFSAGKLLGEQFKMDDRDRKRTLDAYMPYNRSFEYLITIHIPDGYKIESADNFKVNLQNEYAAFTSEPVLEGNTLKIKIKKAYLKTFIPNAEWKKITEVVDAANVLLGQSVVLRKI